MCPLANEFDASRLAALLARLPVQERFPAEFTPQDITVVQDRLKHNGEWSGKHLRGLGALRTFQQSVATLGKWLWRTYAWPLWRG